MTIYVVCPQCRLGTEMPADTVGKKLRCKNCKEIFRAVDSGVNSAVESTPLVVPPDQALPAEPPLENIPLESLGTPIPQPATPAAATAHSHWAPRPAKHGRRTTPTKLAKKTASYSWDALDESEQGLIKTGCWLVGLGVLAMILPSFGLTLKILVLIGDFAPIVGVLAALGGAGCLAAGFQRFPLMAAGAGGSISIASVVLCVVVMIPVFRQWQGNNESGAFPYQTANSSKTGKSNLLLSDRRKSPSVSPFPKSGLGQSQIRPPRAPLINDQNSTFGGNLKNRSQWPSNPSNSTSRSRPSSSDSSSGVSEGSDGDNPFQEQVETNNGLDDNPFVDAGPPSSQELSFANENVEDFFTSPGWFKLKPRRQYLKDRRFGSNREQQIRSDLIEWQRAIDKKLGNDWQNGLPDAFVTETAGRSMPDGAGSVLSIIHPEKVPIVGVRYAIRTLPQGDRIATIVPVFHRENDDANIMARDGYAVAGVNVVGRNSVERMQLIFMKIENDQFVVSDQYTSDWFGDDSAIGKPQTLGGDGRAMFGMNMNITFGLEAIQLFRDMP